MHLLLFELKDLDKLLHILELEVLVQVLALLVGVLCDFLGYLFNLLLREVNVDGEEAFIAVFDSMLLQAVLDGVCWCHMVDDLVPEAVGLHLTISLVYECAGHRDIQVHQASDQSRIHDCEVLLIGLCN